VKNKYHILIIITFLLGLTSWKDEPKKESVETLTTELVNEVAKDNIGSLSVTVLNSEGIASFKSYGPINKFNKFLPDTNTIFRIGSVSKTFEAILMLKLAEEGFFKLDDPIEKYLPEIKLLSGYSDSTKITFRQLASHTAGLARTSNRSGLEQKGEPSEWEKKALSAIPHTKFIIRPSTKMSYSNIGYAILALAMSRAANTPYIKLIHNKVLIPLNMKHTYFEIPYNENVIAGTCDCGVLNHKNMRVPKKKLRGMGSDLPGGGMFSTATDLSKFVAVLMGTSKQRIISEESLQLMQTGIMKYPEAIRRSFKDVEYGLGTVVYHFDNNKMVFAHSGSVPGYWTTYAYNRTKKKAVIIMLNYDKHLDNEGTVVKILNQL
jgi:CubicO group peptidase (beta-lactamase class C family)